MLNTILFTIGIIVSIILMVLVYCSLVCAGRADERAERLKREEALNNDKENKK